MKLLKILVVGGLVSAGCASDGPQVVSGGIVDAQGWPARKADVRLQCPEGTYLEDVTLSDGRREVTCRRPNLPRPMGFQLQWTPQGQLVTHTEFDDDGMPVSRKRWFDDGRRKSLEGFDGGAVHTREVWYPTGAVAEKSKREGNLLHVVRYQADGSVEAEGTLDGDQRVGQWRLFKDSATETVDFVDGLEQGQASRVYLDGTVENGQYVGGKKVGVWLRQTTQGLPVREETYDNGVLSGAFVAYHPNQAIAMKGQYQDGQRVGEWTSYHPNGQLKSRGTFACDKEQLLWEFWHPNGRKAQSGVYVDGVKVGEWNFFSEDQTLIRVDTYGNVEPKCPQPE